MADHQGSKIPFREFRWIDPYIVEKVLTNETYIVRKINSNKTQILHRIRLRKFEPNVPLRDERPEGNLQPDDEIIIPQNDLFVMTWEINFGGFIDSNTNQPNLPMPANTDNISDSEDHSEPPEPTVTDVDLRSTERIETEEILPDQMTRGENDELNPDDKASSGGAILSCPKY